MNRSPLSSSPLAVRPLREKESGQKEFLIEDEEEDSDREQGQEDGGSHHQPAPVAAATRSPRRIPALIPALPSPRPHGISSAPLMADELELGAEAPLPALSSAEEEQQGKGPSSPSKLKPKPKPTSAGVLANGAYQSLLTNVRNMWHSVVGAPRVEPHRLSDLSRSNIHTNSPPARTSTFWPTWPTSAKRRRSSSCGLAS